VSSGHLTWYVARSAGLVAWTLVLTSILWGLVLATRVVGRRRPGPAWLLSMHRYLGALALTFTGVHVGAILLDGYVRFGLVEVLVPLASPWHPVAVAWGIVAMYLLVAVEVTSLLRRHLAPRVWRRLHLLSYALFALATVHLLGAGTDARELLPVGVAAATGTAAIFAGFGAWWWRAAPEPR
jgi:DMSO/TMAO reductase YedYZ heme-binding membrane subunit